MEHFTHEHVISSGFFHRTFWLASNTLERLSRFMQF